MINVSHHFPLYFPTTDPRRISRRNTTLSWRLPRSWSSTTTTPAWRSPASGRNASATPSISSAHSDVGRSSNPISTKRDGYILAWQSQKLGRKYEQIISRELKDILFSKQKLKKLYQRNLVLVKKSHQLSSEKKGANLVGWSKSGQILFGKMWIIF